jgi:acyl carrier protein
MEDIMDIESTVERFLIDEILFGSRTSIAPDESLTSSGILDSLGLLRLVSYVETQFGVTFESHEVVPDHFETIKDIKALVESKRQ